jgi:regulator of cell morphogenesis and NO signaling
MINPTQTLAELALSHPAASRVFRQHRLDFCCGGKRSLADACAERSLDARSILDEITATDSTPSTIAWTTCPIEQLVDHILVNFHAAHRRELPDLVALARKVERVHADKPEVPVGLADHLLEMQEALENHMYKEERILFPAILSGRGAALQGPTLQMEREHDEHALKLQRMRELAGNFVPPAHACTSWRALLLRCEQLEADIMAHVHLENHVLFPRALSGASARA